MASGFFILRAHAICIVLRQNMAYLKRESSSSNRRPSGASAPPAVVFSRRLPQTFSAASTSFS
jgi:hypothetical protein